jgi:hypothetical protein
MLFIYAFNVNICAGVYIIHYCIYNMFTVEILAAACKNVQHLCALHFALKGKLFAPFVESVGVYMRAWTSAAGLPLGLMGLKASAFTRDYTTQRLTIGPTLLS